MEQFFAKSIIGASHIDSKLPMQDYSDSKLYDNCCIGVVCDGHGSAKHFRSERGSRIATEVAMEQLKLFMDENPTWAKASINMNEKIDKLKLAILANWHERILKDRDNDPFTVEELKKTNASFRGRMSYNVGTAYGTTMLATLINKEYYLLLMVGDGAIIELRPDHTGKIVSFNDKTEFDDAPHGVTESMCDYDAYEHMASKCVKLEPTDKGIAFALMSDGLSEVYEDDRSLINKILNYINFFAEEGLQSSLEAIGDQLSQITKISVAKDDISLAFATMDLAMYDEREKEEANNG